MGRLFGFADRRRGRRTGVMLRGMFIALAGVLLLGAAVEVFAHATEDVGPDGQFRISFGFRQEPIYTDSLNGLEIVIRRTADGAPVEFLEQSMLAEIIAPDGVTRKTLTLRAVWGEPGVYTADVVVTEPGVYEVRLWGFIDDVEFDVTFHTHEVNRLDDIKFP